MMRKIKASGLRYATFLIVMVCLLVVFSAPLASSAEWDNVKSYDKIGREVTIKNALGFGADIGTAKLNTPLNVKVGLGYQKVAEFDIITYEDYADALKEFSFTDMKTKKSIERDFDLKYKTYETVIVDDYKKVCSITEKEINQTCNQVKVGSHKEERIKWVEIEKTDLKKDEKLTIGIFTDVKVGDYVDWVPTIYGVEVGEWATWTAVLNTDIVSYYKLDETSGTTMDDELNANDGTIDGATVNQAGLLGKAYTFVTNDQVIISDDASLDFGTGAFSISMWFKTNAWVSGTNYLFSKVSSDHGFFAREIISTGNKINFFVGDGSQYADLTTSALADCTDDNWHHLVFIYPGGTSGTALLYYDGSSAGTDGYTGVDSTDNAVDLYFGSSGTANFYDGEFDEIGIWERALTSDEVTQLYNSGVGITYTEDFNTAPTITLNSPASANYSTAQSLIINLTAYDDINLSDVKLYVNDVLNQTNATGINNTDYLFDLYLTDGEYEIYGEATDNESEETNSDTITIIIDSTEPVITIPDTNDTYVYSLPLNTTLNISVEDDHPATCLYWTSDNSTNITVTCGDEYNISWATGGNKTVYTWVNDTFGNTATANDSFYINYLQESLGYDALVLADEEQTIYLNITATDITTYEINLTYGDVPFTPTVTNSGTLLQAYYTFTNSTPGDYVINWTYNINDFTNSTNVSQTIKELTALNITSGACTDLAVRYVIQDEANATNLTGSISYNIKYGPTLASNDVLEAYGTVSAGNISICINATETPIYYIGYGELQYTASDYVDRRNYMFENSEISNNTYEVKFLRDLENDEQTSFLLTLQDSDLNVYANKYTALWRWYPDLNAYKIVEMGKTDDDGQTVAHVRTEDVDYRTALYELNGSLIKFDSPRRFLCTSAPCSLDIIVGEEGNDLTAYFDIEQSLTYNATTGIITYVFNDPNQLTQSMRLLVEKINPTTEITLCDNTTTGYTGIINCNVSIYSGSFKATAYRTASPEVPIAQKLITTTTSVFQSAFGLFISIILWLAIVLTGLVGGPVLTVILAIIGLIPALFLGSINLAIFTGFAVLGAIILHFIKRSGGN